MKQKIAELTAFRAVAARLHDVIMASAPDLEPRLWYGMPGYAKAKSSPAWFLTELDGPTEGRVAPIVERAAG